MKVVLAAYAINGGIKTFFRYVYARPCFSGHEFVLVTDDRAAAEALPGMLPAGRIRIVQSGGGPAGFIKTARAELRDRDTAILHSHGFTSAVYAEAARSLVKSPPHLMTAHDVFTKKQFEGLPGKAKKVLLRAAFSRINRIHTVTHDARANFESYFPNLPGERFHTIVHGIDTDEFSAGRRYDLKNELGISKDTPIIGFFGRFMSQKGFRDLIDAMAFLVQDKLGPLPMVVTFGWNAFIREDYAFLREKGLGDYFKQAPYTNRMADALKSVDVVAMPSRWEACGLLAMEALVAGVPLVGTSCVGLREILDGTPAYVVRPGAGRELASALRSALERGPEEFVAFQERARRRFDVGRAAAELAALYGDTARTGTA